jgi:hypothetical protein
MLVGHVDCFQWMISRQCRTRQATMNERDMLNLLYSLLAFVPSLSSLFDGKVKVDVDESPTAMCVRSTSMVKNCRDIDHSSMVTFATALNVCCQQHLFQLSQHCQAIVCKTNDMPLKCHRIVLFFEANSSKSDASTNDNLPVQIFELYTDYMSIDLPVNHIEIELDR